MTDNMKQLDIEKVKEIIGVYSKPENNTVSIVNNDKIESCIPYSIHMLLYMIKTGATYIETDEYIYIIEGGDTISAIVSKKNKLITVKHLQDSLNMPNINYVQNIPINLKGITEFNIGNRKLDRYYLYQAQDMIELGGKHFKNIRKQLNKVNKDIENGILRVEYYTMADIPETVIQDIMTLVHRWKDRNIKGNKKRSYIRATIDMLTNDHKGYYRAFNNIHIVVIRDITNNKVITYGVDHLLGNNLIVLTEGKFDTDYTDEYPDINKLVNHFEVKNMVEKYNLDIAKTTFTLDIDPGTETDSYYDYKKRLAPNLEILLGKASNKSKNTSVVFSSKKSIF